MAFGDIGERLALVIDANASGALKGLKKVGDESEHQFSRAKTSQEKWSHGLLIGGTAAVGVAAVIGKGLLETVHAYEDDQIASLKLQSTMANEPRLAKASSSAFIDLADHISKTTAVSKIQAVTSESMLGQFGLNQKQIETLLPLIVDYSVKTGTDMVAATKSVGKAVDGSAGALAKQGIILNKTAYSADHYGTVVRTLRTAVGGFAAKEGKTLEGQLTILQHQFEEFKVNVGHGVVDELHSMGAEVGLLASGMGHLSAGTEQGIGKVATIGTAASSAAGGVMVLAGAAIRARAALTVADGEAGVLGTSLSPMGVAAIGVGVAVGGLTLAFDHFTAHGKGVKTVADEITASMQANGDAADKAGKQVLASWLASHLLEAHVLHASGVSVEEYYSAISGGKGALEDVNTKLDVYKAHVHEATKGTEGYFAVNVATADGVSKLKNQIGLQSEGMDAAKAKASELKSATAGLVDHTDDATRADTELAKALKAAHNATQAEIDVTERLAEKQLDEADASRTVAGDIRGITTAQLDVIDKQKAWTQAIKDHGKNSEEAIRAQIDYQNAVDSVGQATDDTKRAIQDLAAKQSGASSAADAAAHNTTTYVTNLSHLRDTLKPGSPLRVWLDQYIASLKNIPTTVETQVVIKGGSRNQGSGKQFAGGGNPPVGEAVTVGEHGRETAVFTDPVHIYPHGQAPGSAAAAAGGTVIYVDARGSIGLSAGSLARELAAVILRDNGVGGPIALAMRKVAA